MAAKPPVPLEELRKYPRMASWFHPGLLVKLLWRVVVSDLFGQYADRRLIVAALDPVTQTDLVERAQQFWPKATFRSEEDRPPTLFTKDTDGAVWIDFVADLGDGFDATFAIASLLSQETLTVDGLALPRGQLLVMGGDEVYPHADKTFYEKQLLEPYNWAFPDPTPRLLQGPPVYAIPGNHDWYDGLVLFLAYFTRRFPHMHLGGWRAWQRRSYFALQLTDKWWIWAMDAQLDDTVDQPQKDYFDQIAERMEEGSRVILCGPEPGWLYTLQQTSKSFGVVDNVAWSAVRHKAEVPIVLSGDTHHYSRYAGDDGASQFITSGGGGAFLHGTHWLKDKVELKEKLGNAYWLGGKVKELTLGSSLSPATKKQTEACYPSRAESRKILRKDFLFPVLNPGFCALLGGMYWLAGLALVHLRPDAYALVPIILALGFWAYTKRTEGNTKKVAVVSALNGLIHGAGVIAAALLCPDVTTWLKWGDSWALPALAFAMKMAIAGFAFGGFMFGVYLYVSARFLDINQNDAFSALRLDGYRNFLRFKITEDAVTIYPIGLTRVPTRQEWHLNEKQMGSPPPAYVPVPALQPHLIEQPIIITIGAAKQS